MNRISRSFLLVILSLLCGTFCLAKTMIPSLPQLEEKAFDYFWQTCHTNGFMPTRLGMANTISSAGTGYQLNALCIGADRGWISREDGTASTLKILKALSSLPRFHGFWAEHYDARKNAVIALTHPDNDGAHTMSTAYLAAGLITAQNYFISDTPAEQELTALCTSMLADIEWNWMLGTQQNNENRSLAAFWSPTKGFSSSRLNAQQDLSGMLAYILAIASTTHPIPASCWNDGWCTTYQWEHHGTLSFIVCPPLAAHQQAQVWLDFENRQDRQADYFRNATAATIANHNYALSNLYPEKQFWGISDCMGPNGYEIYGYPPLRGKVNQDATLSTAASIGSILFTPPLSQNSIHTMLSNYSDKLLGEYGFYESFSPRHDWFFTGYSTRQQGIILSMLANHRDEFVHELFMKETAIRNALDQIGFVGIIADFENHTDTYTPYALLAPSRYYSTSLTTATPRQGTYALNVTYNKKNNPGAALKLYPNEKDFSTYHYITFWVSNLKDVALRLVDSQNHTALLTKPIQGPGNRKDWQRLYFELPAQGVNLSSIKCIDIIADPRENKARGEFKIDGMYLANTLTTSQPHTPFRFDVRESRMPGEVVLSWQKLSDKDTPVPYQYHIRYSSSSMRNAEKFAKGISASRGDRRIDGATTNLHVGGLAMGQTIYFAIQAEDLHGNLSDISDNISIQLPQKRLPSEFSLEDFDADGMHTAWKSDTPAIQVRQVTDVSLEGSGSLQIDYHKQGEKDLWSSLILVPDINNMQQYNYLSMWVAGKADIVLRVIDTHGNSQDTPLKTADSTDAWAPVFFDLARLKNIDRKSIDHILLFIEPDKTNIAGTLYVDSVTLSTSRQ